MKVKKQFMQMIKRSVCAVLSFAMAVTLLTSADIFAQAAETEPMFTIAKGGTRFFDYADINQSVSGDPSVITVETGSRSQKALFNCESAANHNLSGYSTTPNLEIDMSEAEFLVESSGDTYTIYNETEQNYLANAGGASSYFAKTAITHSLNRVKHEDGTSSFEICRVSDDRLNGRYVYFHYDVMRFEALSEKSDTWKAEGDFEFVFLEKKNKPSNLDPIPGYQRVSEIQSGHSYLITKFYHDEEYGDVIFVLYPRNGVTELSKLCRLVDIPGVLLTAVGDYGQTAQVTIDGVSYEVRIEECMHEGYPYEVRDERAADCENPAYTGDTYCTNCNKKIQEGTTQGEPLGHSFGEWTMSKTPTATENGERTRTCKRCAKQEKEEVDNSEYISQLLADKIAEAKQYKEKHYTSESFAVLKKALEEAEKLTADASNQTKLTAVDAIDQAVSGLVRVLVENVVTALKSNVTDAVQKNYFSYTAYSGKTWAVGDAETYIDLGVSDTRAQECFYEVHFEGNGIAIFANRSYNHGKVKFSVDGGQEQIVDLYHAQRQEPVAVYRAEGLEEGVHVLKAMTLTEKNESSRSIVNQVVSAEITHQPYVGGTPDLGGLIGDTDTQYTQDRYGEVLTSEKLTEKLSAWKNDKATSEIVLYSKNCSLEGVTVTAGALTSGSHTIDADHVKTTFIRSTKAYNGGYLGYGDKTRPVPEATTANRSESSDILYQQGGAMDLGYDSLLPVWVEFDIPKDAAAGTYTGTLTATADGIETPLTFTYTIDVKDITLPDASAFQNTFDIELWQYPYSSAEYYDVEPFSPEHLKIMESSMQIYKDLGGHAITTSIIEEAWNGQTYSANDVHYPSMIRWEKNGDSFTYDYSDFDAWVEFCREMGIGDKIVLYSIAPWHNSFAYWEGGRLKYEAYTAGSARYNQVWGDFFRDLIRHLEEKGWFEQSYVGIDERGFCAAAFDLIDSIKNSKGETLKTAGAMDGFVNKKDLAMRVDDLNVGDNAAAAHAEDFAKLLEERNAAGLRTTLYSCTEHKPGNFSLSAPIESYWGMVNAAKMGTAGFLRWAYDAWVADPLNDATHNAFEPGDCFLIYPDHKDAEFPTSKRSVRLERMAEGVRDVNKLMFLEQEMPDLANDIRNLYDAITVTAGTSRSYLSHNEKTRLIGEMTAFQEGIDRITDAYLKFATTTEPGLHLMSREKELKVGDEYTIPVKLVTDQADKTIVYASSDPSIASVDATGTVTGRRLGCTEIVLKAAGYTATLTVTVSANALSIKNTLTDYKLPEQYLSDVEKAPDASHERHYLGQPDMVMLNDNQTLITVFPVGHGRGKIVMKVSEDAGESWKEKQVPDSWLDSFETPTIYKLNMTDGTEKLIVISGRPESFGAPSGGWDSSVSIDGGKTWPEFETYCKTLEDGSRNETVVAMASLIQLKDAEGNDIDKWMGVYHNGGSFVNYKTYLTFDEEGNQQWTTPVPYLSQYRQIEQSHQICEVGMFRSPDEKRIVALARSQSHNHPATMFYSDDEGETWSEPIDLPGSLAGERHKAMYDPTDPTGQRMIVTFREIQYDLNNNNQFDGFNDWLAGDWIAWVGTYDQLMNLEDGMYRILLCEDWAANAKSGDTGYTGLVVQPNGVFIMDSYGHWDREYSESLPNYNVYNDMCWIKQAKFKLSIFDEQAVPTMQADLREELAKIPGEAEKSQYTEASFNRMQAAAEKAKQALNATTQTECGEALYQLKKMKSLLVMKGAETAENPVTGIAIMPDELVMRKIGAAEKLTATIAPSDATDSMVLWKSNDPEIAVVSNKGMVMAIGNGTTTITAEAADGSGVKATARVEVTDPGTVTEIKVTGISLNPAALTFDKLGEKKTITAQVTPADASNQTILWKSDRPSVATVSETGEVTAVANGNATITAEAADGSGVKATASVTVAVKDADISPRPVSYVSSVKLAFKKYEIAKGKSVNLTKDIVSLSPADAENKTLTWKSSNPKIATVGTTTGIVKVTNNKRYVKKTAMITAMNAEGAVVAKVSVKVMNGKVSKVKAKGKKTLRVQAGKNVTLKAFVSTKGKKPVNKKLRWTTSNKSIAAVSNRTTASMKVKIAKKAKKGQRVKITATSMDGTNKKVTFTIQVK